MKKTKLLTSLAALALVLGLGSCGTSDNDQPEDETEDTTQEGELEENEPEAHTHAYVLEYVAPTCLENGSVTFTCSDCKDTITESIPALGHDFDNGAYGYDESNHWKVCARCGQKGTESAHETTSTTTEASCTEAGLTVTSCGCGYTTSEAIDPTGHTWEVSETTAATCTADGKTTYKCSECEETYEVVIPKTGHNFVAGETTDATCTTDGKTTYSCANCEESYDVVIPKTGHDWEAVTTAATCTTDGSIVYTCKNCNATHTEVISALGHTYGNGVVTLLPTCTESGEVVFTCSVCSDTLTVTLEPTELNHDYSVYVKDAESETHHTVCSRCNQTLEGSETACTYKLNKYVYGDENALYRACDVCNGLSAEAVDTPTANADGTYDYVANSSASLDSALDALGSVESTSDGAQSTITLTEDLDLAEDSDGSAYEFSASNFILDGGEDGVTLEVSNQSTISGENVTFTNITLDGSGVEASSYNATVQVTGGDVTFDGCTIVGCENGTTYTSALYITSSTGCEVNVTDCEITGAFRGIYLNGQADSTLYVTDTYIDSIYCFNDTGASNSNFYFENSSLMGWTSYATSGIVTFTNCTLGFNDSTNQCYGFIRGYHGDTLFTDCLFRSFASRQAETENTLTNTYRPYVYIGHDNYMFGLGGSDVTYTLLNCQFEHVNDTDGSTEYETIAITYENAGYLMSTDFGSSSYSACGFRFSTCEEATVYNYSYYSSNLFNNN